MSSLAKKNIAVFQRGKTFLIDLEDDCSFLGYESKDKKDLFYIGECQKSVPKVDSTTTHSCVDGSGEETFVEIENVSKSKFK